MPIRINVQNILRATLATMLLSASFHLAASLFFAVKNNDPDYANMFNVIGLSWFFPELGTGTINSILGILLVIGAGMAVYFVMERHDALQSKKR